MKDNNFRYSQPFSILREGIVIGGCSFLCALAVSFVKIAATIPFILFGVWAIYFFRDPERVVPQHDGVAVSPADGVIMQITNTIPEKSASKEKYHCISIFMNAFDVHVNRMPMDATVKDIQYIKGKFINASLDKSSSLNERCIYICEHKKHGTFFIKQIAGFVARRIVPFCAKKDSLAIGDRFGLIRFGSRVDFYLPKTFTILAQEGQRAIAGETVLAQAKNQKN